MNNYIDTKFLAYSDKHGIQCERNVQTTIFRKNNFTEINNFDYYNSDMRNIPKLFAMERLSNEVFWNKAVNKII